MPSLNTSIANNPDVISLVSAEGEVLFVSASSANVFGYHPDELVGRNIFALVHPDDRDKLADTLERVVASPVETLRVEARICRKDWRWASVESMVSNLLNEPRVRAIIVNYREIGANIASKAAADTQELHSPKTEFENFAWTAVHDLREPLNTISMFTNLLVHDGQFDSDHQPLAQSIMDGVTRMFALLDGLHSLAVPGPSDSSKSFDLRLVVADVLQNVAAAIGTSQAVVTVDPLPEVQGHPNHLLRVLQNLILNAIKYRSEAPVRIHVSAEALGSDWIVKVKDNGIGIAQEYHECIFRPLKRLHGQNIPGAGIGLAVCKRIVEGYGGRIWVESNPGAGSTFCFTIPAAIEQSATAALPVEHRCVNGSLSKRLRCSRMHGAHSGWKESNRRANP